MGADMLYNKRLGITEKDVMDTDDLELLSKWKIDLTFQYHWLKVECEDEEERKLQARLRTHVSKFSRLVMNRMHTVKKKLREDAGIPHILKKERKKTHLQADKFMTAARLLLPKDVFDSILAEAKIRREQAVEMAHRFREECNF